MALPVRFFTEIVPHEDGGSHERDVIETTHPDGTQSVRPATEDDQATHPDEFADFVNADIVPTYDELLAEWRIKHPKPTAAQTAENLAKKKAGAASEEAKSSDAPTTVRGAAAAKS